MGTSQPDWGIVSIKGLPHLSYIVLCYYVLPGLSGEGLLIEPFHFKGVKSLDRACTLLTPGLNILALPVCGPGPCVMGWARTLPVLVHDARNQID